MNISRRDLLKNSAALLTAASVMTALDSVASPRPDQSGWRLPEKNKFDVIENQWIVMKDGTRLSARLWLPSGAANTPAPVVWEYIPYRKRDFYRSHDNSWGQQLAQYGIAFARVDARGSGDSEGVLLDEYLDQELNYGVEVIAWLARQPWSNGNVGMRGISWGGINTLQIAALGPPALKAIMPMCCTDTRYTDDAHYIGGALGLTDLQWGTQFKAVMATPPDPAIVGDRWREMWQQRLDSAPPILQQWLSHQRNDAFWQRGSVSRDYSTVKCPVYIVDGWVDTYVNTVSRVLANVTGPRKALIGPWAHDYPESGSPGPSLDWVFEEVRWWKDWLAGVSTGIMDEPMLRVYMPYATASQAYPADIPGRWIADSGWPPTGTTIQTWFLDDGRLSPKPGSQAVSVYVADKIVGLQKPEWLPFPPAGLPREQTPDDQHSLLFDTAPLESDLEILGHPVARIRVSANRPVAKLALRLCEVTSDGKSWLVTYGLLNLTHRDSDENPTPLTPGKTYDVRIDLSLIAHRFKRGSRIRLAVSESLWPLVWPSPEVVTLTLTHLASSLELPVRPLAHDPAFPIPVIPTSPTDFAPRGAPQGGASPDANGWYEIRQDAPPFAFTVPDTGTTISGALALKERLRIRQGDNNSCTWEGERTSGLKRGDWNCTVFTSFRISSTPKNFFIEETLRALDGEKLIFERVNKSTVPRDLM
jgi:putative CocE/NonD family hydrolase